MRIPGRTCLWLISSVALGCSGPAVFTATELDRVQAFRPPPFAIAVVVLQRRSDSTRSPPPLLTPWLETRIANAISEALVDYRLCQDATVAKSLDLSRNSQSNALLKVDIDEDVKSPDTYFVQYSLSWGSSMRDESGVVHSELIDQGGFGLDGRSNVRDLARALAFELEASRWFESTPVLYLSPRRGLFIASKKELVDLHVYLPGREPEELPWNSVPRDRWPVLEQKLEGRRLDRDPLLPSHAQYVYQAVSPSVPSYSDGFARFHAGFESEEHLREWKIHIRFLPQRLPPRPGAR